MNGGKSFAEQFRECLKNGNCIKMDKNHFRNVLKKKIKYYFDSSGELYFCKKYDCECISSVCFEEREFQPIIKKAR